MSNEHKKVVVCEASGHVRVIQDMLRSSNIQVYRFLGSKKTGNMWEGVNS